jgi:hypothetical protein
MNEIKYSVYKYLDEENKVAYCIFKSSNSAVSYCKLDFENKNKYGRS